MVDIGKILVICANGDKPINKNKTLTLIGQLLTPKYLDINKVYELISVNPDEVKDSLVYDKHLTAYFGKDPIPDMGTYDAIILQNCMTCLKTDLSFLKIPGIIGIIKDTLNKNGLFINNTSCYWDNTKDLKQDFLSNGFFFYGTILDTQRVIQGREPNKLDVLKKI
jgi:hypothetical protein